MNTTTSTGTTTTVTSGGSTTVYTGRAGFPLPRFNDLNWHLPLQALIASLDTQAAIGPFSVTATHPGLAAALPSSSLVVTVAGGLFLNARGEQIEYTGGSFTLAASLTTRLWLDDTGVLYEAASYPTGLQILPLASVTTSAASVTAIGDDRVLWRSFGGSAAGFVNKAGDTLAEGSNFSLGTTSGTRLGTDPAQRLAFFGASPVPQPASASDLRAALIALGLLAGGGATPLNLNGGTLTGGLQLPVTAVNASMALTALGLFLVSAAGNITITLPDAASNAGGLVILKRIDNTTSTVTVARAGTDTIDGAATSTSLSAQWTVLRLIAMNNGWVVV